MPWHGSKVSETMTNKIEREGTPFSSRARPYMALVETNSGGLSTVSQSIWPGGQNKPQFSATTTDMLLFEEKKTTTVGGWSTSSPSLFLNVSRCTCSCVRARPRGRTRTRAQGTRFYHRPDTGSETQTTPGGVLSPPPLLSLAEQELAKHFLPTAVSVSG